MSIIVNVDVMMARRKMSSQELAEKIGITQANLSILKTVSRATSWSIARTNPTFSSCESYVFSPSILRFDHMKVPL